MLFNSFAFAIFLPIVFIIYWSMPHKYRWLLILVASYYFYMSWNAKYVVLILFTTIDSYVAAILIERENSEKKKKLILLGMVIICLGILFLFKYFNFTIKSVTTILRFFSIKVNPITIKILLPVGISFYTFQTLSYVIDVYKGDVPAEHHFGYYASFISFFPQLVAGPIERTSNLLPQIKAQHEFDYDQSTYGLKLMAWGFFKKIVIADTLAKYVSVVYESPRSFSGFALVLAAFFFSIQIYCDFSGYSDIAVGTAKLVGINLTTNFKSPYFSLSIKEFWSRWHISLSTWLRDYVYKPLGGNRVTKARHIFNLIVTFLISGLWHGANWTYVVWGGIHGIAQALESIIIQKKEEEYGMKRWIKLGVIYLFVTFAWIFFAANSFTDAIYIIGHLGDGFMNPISYFRNGFRDIDMSAITFVEVCSFILVLALYDYLSLTDDVIVEIGKLRKVLRWILYIIILLVIVFLSQKGASADFVYFQF